MTEAGDDRAPVALDVAVIGGYGGFGRRIVDMLATDASLRIGVIGRRLDEARAFCLQSARPGLQALALDAHGPAGWSQLFLLRPRVVIDTAGPFQRSDRQLARACAQHGSHYIDLADDAAAVTGIVALDAEARAHGVLVASGASTVPSLSIAVVDDLARDLATVERIEIGIAPGYDGPRGLATIRSILSYVGRPIPQWQGGRTTQAAGWSGTIRHPYPAPVGLRLLSRVDVPDTALLPGRYPTLQTLEIRAGLEVSLAHRGLGWLGWLVEHRLLRDLESRATAARAAAAWLDRWGSDSGAMHVRVIGRDAGGARRSRLWTVVATGGDGPRIPGTAAVILARRLLGLAGPPLPARGAMPAVGLVSLEEFEAAWRGAALHTSVVEEPHPVGG
jgi:hypothetical protein